MALTRLKNKGITDSTIANVKLVNDSVTVNGTTFDLGTSDSITAGKVLQVVQGKASIQVSTTSNSFTATGLNVTITPSSTSNKVLIIGTSHANVGNNTGIYAVYRNDTTNVGTWGYQSLPGYQDAGFTMLDSPATTSATEYEVYFRSNISGQEVSCAPNDVSHYIIALEIAG